MNLRLLFGSGCTAGHSSQGGWAGRISETSLQDWFVLCLFGCCCNVAQSIGTAAAAAAAAAAAEFLGPSFMDVSAEPG